ncbi:hypothetical protein [Streptomyces sp. G-G2]|uniref:hypothetical protein n=1 Tax=Streptomyces sp. G-G2 TaxID=3046201 RepID=UPI0024B9865D|nr:hypothetical protein [Streptomyces sp. G-G2]MDJ0383991.1 hypothetical protein [Streptomyces sp. G-G2]
MNLRLIGIGAGVLIILSLPLAGAIAGPDFAVRDDGKGGGLLTSLGLSESSGRPSGAKPAPPGPPEQPRTDARCGPELSSPQGVEAQTCVLTGDGQSWGRSYYRNTSGRPLESVLTVMGPAGRTVQIRCAIGAGDEPGLCETPREHSMGTPDRYAAVAEFAVPDAEGPLLLRSGSNSPAPTGG